MKLFLKFLIAAAILFVVVILTSAGLALFYNQPPEDGLLDDSEFTVERGESVGAIARRLGQEGLIRSPIFMRVLAKIKATESSFQSGSYRIAAGSSTLQVHNTLVSGREILTKVTVPEGWTISRVAASLDAAGIVSAEEFITAAGDSELLGALDIAADSVEGYLFPDTYLLPRVYPAEKVIEAMVERFRQVLAEIHPDSRFMDPEEIHEMVILASVIEREYVVPDEAPLMASVFYNRLEDGMPLQSCATVVYALSEELGRDHPEFLTLRDLEVESEYNTYRNNGLPPGPIANPGKTALTSVFAPAQTDFLFFLLKDPSTGEHEFTVTYRDHLDAKYLYIKKS